ncbi:MAG: efflux RND transporter periplasmic adaptor subunit [Micavibrio sp.]|nr:MAG: efflux RND transporter periplasmic adaptor subunit [Micavibrio sp.]
MLRFLKIILPVAVLLAGLYAGKWYLDNPDTVERRPPPAPAALPVEAVQVESGTHHVVVEVLGQVIPAQNARIRPRVGGEILEASENFVPGGYFAKGEEILRIDPADYTLEVQKQRAILNQAEAAYRLEMGRQKVAENELKMLERTTGRKPDNTDLALRRPQLEQARAEMEKARADLDVAELALERTVVTAPFNALVTARHAVPGDRVSAQDALADLVEADEYWIEVSVPLRDLQRIDFPASAVVEMDGGRGTREAVALRMTGSLDRASRLADVLVSVRDPMLLGEDAPENAAPVMISDYVKVMITARPLENAVRLLQSHVRDGGIVWTAAEDGTLRFNPVEIAFSDRRYAYITAGLAEGDIVVTSDIAVPVEGMKIRTGLEEHAETATEEESRFKAGALIEEGETQ